MNNQAMETQNGNSQDAVIDKLVSPLAAHAIGVAAFALAIGSTWLFDMSIKVQSMLWLAAIVVYSQLYREAHRD